MLARLRKYLEAGLATSQSRPATMQCSSTLPVCDAVSHSALCVPGAALACHASDASLAMDHASTNLAEAMACAPAREGGQGGVLQAGAAVMGPLTVGGCGLHLLHMPC